MKTRFVTIIGVVISAAHLALCEGADAQTVSCAARSSGEGKRVAEAGFVAIGGIDQWVTIRGDDKSNPIVLHVHGGPGIAFSAFTAEFAPYEGDFTVVQWDQRGAGCTFGRYGRDTPDLTLERLARDGIDLAGYLQRRLPDAGIVVLGHSFGSIIATEIVQRAPERFAAYVGTGQVGSFARSVDAQIAYMRARTAGDSQMIAKLDALDSLDSRTLEKFGAVNRLLASRVPAVDAAFFQALQSRAAEAMTPTEFADWQAGRDFSVAQLSRQLPGVDLFSTVTRLEVPFVVIQGADDANTPTDSATAFFEHVDAPAKELIIVAGAGHFPHLTHTKEFLRALMRVPSLH
jgi:pimeloyl-ACP methyl ester carboxylesterase